MELGQKKTSQASKTEDKRLILASDTKITRHRLIKFAANPYLKEYEDYYRNRRFKLN